jgi:hypothetical protein
MAEPLQEDPVWNRLQHWQLPLQFWPQALVGWFAQAEYIFQTKRTTDSFNKYCHLAVVLPPDTIRLMMDIIDVTPAQQPYETLKEGDFFLVSRCQSKREALPHAGALVAGNNRSCWLLYWSSTQRQRNTRTFARFFLHCLPRELRILSAQEDLSDLKLLAARADALHTHHKGNSNTVVNAVANA